MHKYDRFQAEDFLMDDHFINWLLKPDEELNQFWENYQRENPEQVSNIARAIQLFEAVKRDKQHLTADEFRVLQHNVNARIEAFEEDKKQVFFNTNWLKIAASISVLAVASLYVVWRFSSSEFVIVKTAYGAQQTIILPDSSVVTLNGNSSIKYSENLNEEVLRHVWLDGEAFFHVKASAQRKFRVHTDDLDVEVLGTRFNVDEREGTTKVVLKTGKVKVIVEDENMKSIYLHPGEMVEYKKAEAAIVKQNVNPDNFSSWKDRALVFDHTSVADIALMLEERYGYNIRIDNDSLANKLFTAQFPTDDLDVMIEAMEKALDMEVLRQDEKTMTWKRK